MEILPALFFFSTSYKVLLTRALPIIMLRYLCSLGLTLLAYDQHPDLFEEMPAPATLVVKWLEVIATTVFLFMGVHSLEKLVLTHYLDFKHLSTELT